MSRSGGKVTPSGLQGSPALTANDLLAYNGTAFVPAPLKSAFWRPSGVIDETTSDRAGGETITLEKEKLFLVGNLVCPAGVALKHVAFVSGSQAAVEPHHWFFNVVDLAELKVRATSADQTTTAWGSFTVKTLEMEEAFTPSVDTALLIGIAMASTGLPVNLKGQWATSGWAGRSPVFFGVSNTGVTTPIAVGTTVTAPTPANHIPAGLIAA